MPRRRAAAARADRHDLQPAHRRLPPGRRLRRQLFDLLRAGMAQRQNGTRAVLFDLDGTLADTAADLAARAEPPARRARACRTAARDAAALRLRGRARPAASRASASCPTTANSRRCARPSSSTTPRKSASTRACSPAWRNCSRRSSARPALGHRHQQGDQLHAPLVAALGLEARAACVVCGDTTPHLKPHPAPLLHAAKLLALAPRDCVYLGDDLRDVQAARAAGMRSVAVEWGYRHREPAADWNADAIIARPQDLIRTSETPYEIMRLSRYRNGGDLVSTRVSKQHRACRGPEPS